MRLSFVAGTLITGIVVAVTANAPAWGHTGLGGDPGALASHSVREPHDSRPPGWSHGSKVGWGRAHLPPGLERH